ncbi:MAG TPA: peptidoglycan-binding domain-containing protein [Candidatus Paceibacterota bacterium]|nr:peptidoglycan-binding domain-containing protein [Candidatus Paceibacterota bacterium]
MRLTKQFLYGLFFLIILGLIGWGVWAVFVKPTPSCFNNYQDEGELGVDCGGSCISCDVKNLQPIKVSSGWPKWFKATENSSGLIAEIYNPNSSWAARSFDYTFTIKDQFGSILDTITGTSFVYGGELKYIGEPRIELEYSKITSIEPSISNIDWVYGNDYQKPQVEAQEIHTVKTDVLSVNGKIINQSEISFSKSNVYALVFNKNGDFIAASKTIIDNLDKFSSKEFVVSFSKDIGLYSPSQGSFSFGRNLVVGDSGDDVRMLQSILMEGGYISRDPTGYYDEITKQGVLKLQEEFGIPSSGEVDDFTRQALNTALQASVPESTKLETAKAADPSRTKVFVEAKR